MKIVSAAPSHTEILFALGLGSQVVGITAHCDYPPEAAGKPRVGLFARPDLAKVVSLQPDLVVASGNITGSQREELREAGIQVMDFLPRTVAELFAGMENIVEIAGAGRVGRDLVASLRERVKRVMERAALYAGPRVFFLMGEDPLTTPGPGSCQGYALSLAGARLMPAGKGAPVLFPSWDELASFDPEIIIACGVAPGGLPRKRCPGCQLTNPPCARDVSDLPGRPYLAKLTAVKRGRVYAVPCHWLCRPGPRLINGIEKLFEVFYS